MQINALLLWNLIPIKLNNVYTMLVIYRGSKDGAIKVQGLEEREIGRRATIIELMVIGSFIIPIVGFLSGLFFWKGSTLNLAEVLMFVSALLVVYIPLMAWCLSQVNFTKGIFIKAVLCGIAPILGTVAYHYVAYLFYNMNYASRFAFNIYVLLSVLSMLIPNFLLMTVTLPEKRKLVLLAVATFCALLAEFLIFIVTSFIAMGHM